MNCKKVAKIHETKPKYNKTIMLARRTLHSIESKISEAQMNNKIIHEDIGTIDNKEKTIKN